MNRKSTEVDDWLPSIVADWLELGGKKIELLAAVLSSGAEIVHIIQYQTVIILGISCLPSG
jgi:hypothetical protein